MRDFDEAVISEPAPGPEVGIRFFDRYDSVASLAKNNRKSTILAKNNIKTGTDR
jgi:hypothetical protein